MGTIQRQAEFVRVTPAMAKEFLKHNVINRKFRRSHYETLRQAFDRGEYVPTHQGIAFDTDGNLVDGQHRLTAIANQPEDFSVEILVVRGLEKGRAFTVIDTTQAKRSVADVLNVDRHVAETANFLARMFHGGTMKLTPPVVVPFINYISAEIAELMQSCGTTAKTWSSAPVRAAAAIRMKDGNGTYVKEVYRALVLSDFEKMPRVAQSLYRAHAGGKVRAGAANDMFARCFRAFSHEAANNSKIQISDLSSLLDNVRAKIRNEVDFDGKGQSRPGKKTTHK